MTYPKIQAFREPAPGRSLIHVPGPQQGGGHGHYDPNQPRVPAGHPDGGQWMRGGAGVLSGRFPHNAWPPGAQLDGRYGVQIFSDLIPDNTWAPGAQYAAGGNDNNIQHQKGVEVAKQELLKLGFSVIEQSPVAVDVPGFSTPRYYDFIVQAPDTGEFVGVEVKTTLSDTIRLNPEQVAKDVAVMRAGGTARLSNIKVVGVFYKAYCWGCEHIDLRSSVLRRLLDAAKIPYHRGLRPNQKLP